MSNKITENLDNILEQVEANLLPENLKKGVSLLGVEGTLEQGTDTSDADATASDIASGKTAYINGEKITGTVYTEETGETLSLSSGHITEVKTPTDSNDLIVISYFGKDMLFRAFSYLQNNIPADKIIDAIGLTADKIVKGNTVLGIEGTAETGGTSLGEYSATFISDKPYSDGSNVIVQYTNDENKLDSIPEPAAFSGKFNGYCDETTNKYNSSIVTLTTDTVFTKNKVYRASNTEGYVYTFTVNESDKANCSIVDNDGNQVTSLTTDILLDGTQVDAPEISTRNGYRHIGWINDSNYLAIFEQTVTGSATIHPIITNRDDVLTFTLIPGDTGFVEYHNNIAFDYAYISPSDGILGILGERGESDIYTSIAGWKSLTYTVDTSTYSNLDIVGFLGLSGNYVEGYYTLIDAETGEEITSGGIFESLDFTLLESGKTYKLDGNTINYQ